MISLFLYIFFLTSFTNSENYLHNGSVKSKILFLREFLVYLKRPVYGYFCWKRDQIGDLQRELSHKLIQSRFFTGLGNFNDTIPQKKAITFVIDLNCKFAEETLIKANENQLFRKAHAWIIFGNILEELTKQNYAFSFYSDVFFVYPNFMLTKVYRNSELSKNFSQRSLRTWSTSKMKFLKGSFKHKIDFNGDPIRVSYALIFRESIQHLTDYRQTDKDIIPKMIYILMSNLAYFLNATHMPTFRTLWGDFDSKTGLYSPGGMFSDLQQGRSDVAGNSALITHERLKDFRFLAADTTPDMLSWFFRSPRLISTKNIWVLTFHRYTWYCSCAAGLFGGIIFSGIVLVENIFLSNQHVRQSPTDVIFDISTAYFTQRGILFICLMVLGATTEFVSWSGKLAYGIFAQLNLYVFTAFTAQFFVLLQSPNNKISTFDELFKSKIDIGAEDAVYNRFYFTKKNDLVDESLRLKIFTNKIKGHEAAFFLNETIGMEKVRQGYFAFHILNPTAYRIIEKSYNEYEKKTIRILKPIIEVTKLFLCVPKNSSMEDSISVGLLRLIETGIKNMEFLRLFPSKPIPDYSGIILFVGIGLRDLFYLYVGLGCGIMLSMVILLMERIYYRINGYRRYRSCAVGGRMAII